jgi:DNA-binding IclR family transcriptional regulator
MDGETQQVSEGFDRLQEKLLAMRIGEQLSAGDAAAASGLSEQVCRTVLEGLTRAGLMTRAEDDRFVRCTLDLLGTP